MARMLIAIFAAYMVMSAAYVALIFLLLAGLIFRTKDTLGLIVLGFGISLFSAHPVLTILGAVSVFIFTRLGNAYLLIRDGEGSNGAKATVKKP